MALWGRAARARVSETTGYRYDHVEMTTPNDTHAVATFGTNSTRQFVGCRVCGRTLLLGERSVGFFTPTGEGPYDVCELCVPRAHRYGLRPRPSTADEVARARSGSLLGRISGLFGGSRSTTTTPKRRARGRVRSEQPVDQGTAAVAAASAAPGTGRRGKRRAAAPADLGAVPVGAAAIPVALAAFNQSSHARTLAGLHRTLGAPRASVAARSATDREVILTVAWEIVWYQFRIMPDGIEQQRGQYLTELQPRWQQWNCEVGTDGRVREPGAAPVATGQNVVEEPMPSEAPRR